MSHAQHYLSEIEVPAKISDRFVTYHDDIDIGEHLLSLEHWRPGLFDAMLRMIDVLEADSGTGNISVDFDQESILYPVTIWAESLIPVDEEEGNLRRIDEIAEHTLNCHADLLLVAVM